MSNKNFFACSIVGEKMIVLLKKRKKILSLKTDDRDCRLNLSFYFSSLPKQKVTEMGLCKCVCTAVPDSLQPHELQPTRPFCPWHLPGKNTGACCHFFLQGIFLSQGLNLGMLYHRQILHHLSQGSPSMDMNLSKLREIVKDREALPAAVHRVTKSQTQHHD